ncbi:MAG: hypothetical protein HC836_46830 [Richelia sp. RM2_1_2]|nr:hypothetical protein [Richelia sp. RM2_1_2]
MPPETPKSFVLTTELLNSVLKYLNTRPYGEVSAYINAIGKEIEPQFQVSPLQAVPEQNAQEK